MDTARQRCLWANPPGVSGAAGSQCCQHGIHTPNAAGRGGGCCGGGGAAVWRLQEAAILHPPLQHLDGAHRPAGSKATRQRGNAEEELGEAQLQAWPTAMSCGFATT